MELKFGQMLGEDPKLTLAKIMGRKSNPDVSYLDIEKSFYKKKGKLRDDEVQNVPFDVSDKDGSNSENQLNLVRPVPKKGIKFNSNDKPNVAETKKPTGSVGKAVGNNFKGSIPNVILRKPTTFKDDEDGATRSPSRLKFQPNLSLKMGKQQDKDKFSDMTLLRKPEPIIQEANETKNSMEESPKSKNLSLEREPEHKADSVIGLQPLEPVDMESSEKESMSSIESSEKESIKSESSDKWSVDSGAKVSVEAALLGKPTRLDQSMKDTLNSSREGTLVNSENQRGDIEMRNFLETSPLKDSEDVDWTRAEDLVKTGGREEVELISSSTRGFVASFGSLIGFLPYRNLAAKSKFLAFESWLRKKGLDPSTYKKNLGIIGSHEASKMSSPNSDQDTVGDQKVEEEILPDMQLEDLLRIYDHEKIKFLSSFVGQKIKVHVVMADRNSRRLIFSGRPKEKEEMVEKKRSLMAKLSVGDVVKCCIKKITYFGIFVEVEGVPALIHQTEVSWDATLDPASYYKIGQIVDAKVHQLDFALERIFLSLKEITPDPLIEALESVVGDHNSLDGRLEAAQADTEWADVESLIKELEQIEGIESVSRGRFFLSPGLAPTFQVYMASMFENQYKLLARAGNKVQEVIVQASLNKEEMKAAILTCTNRVE